MIRKLTGEDRALFLELADEFYHTDGVLHPVPMANLCRTFEAILAENPYVSAFMIEKDGRAAGYGQLSFTWSTEAGGMVVWLEELYIRPAFQGQGLGSEYFHYVMEHYKDKAARFRLEVEPGNEGAIRLYKKLGYEDFPYIQMIREWQGAAQ